MRKLNPLLIVCFALVFVSTVRAQSASGVNNAELNGNYAFSFNGISGSGGGSSAFAAVGRFKADGAGNVTNGELDTNGIGPGAVLTAQTFTGTYAIGADNRGVMTLNISGGVAKFALAMMANGNAQFIKFDAAGGSGMVGSGTMEKVDITAYNPAKIMGDYAFGVAGFDASNRRTAFAGRLTANGAGIFTDGAADINVSGTASPVIFTTANYTVSDTTSGRGTINLASSVSGVSRSFNFVFYIVNAGKLFAMETDAVTGPTPLLNGLVLQQQTPAGGFSNASLNGGMVIYLTARSTCGSGTASVAIVLVGLLTADGKGALNLTFDQNCGGAPNSVTGLPGTYIVASNGRLSSTIGTYNVVAYLVGSNQAFLLGTDSSGFIEPQTAGSFTNSEVKGTYAGVTTTPATFGVVNFSGEFTANGASPTGDITGTEDIGAPSGPNSGVAFNATYSVSSSPTNGRGTLTVTSGSGGSGVAYVVSPSKFVAISLSDPNPAVLIFEQPPPLPTLSSLTLRPSSVTGGNSSTGTVTLSVPAPSDDAVVSLSSSDTSVATVPSTATVPAGARSATFRVITSTVTTSTSVTISASYRNGTQTVTLTVNPAPVAPSITTQPASQTVTAGQTATFSVTASGTAPLNYQWWKNNSAISGANSASYTTPPTQTSDNGAPFFVVVRNSAGSTTSNTATLTVNAQHFTLTVSETGAGSGTVTSSPAGINCGSTCSASYVSGITVTLTATPDFLSGFGGWSGCDAVSGQTCTVNMNALRSVTATFTFLGLF